MMRGAPIQCAQMDIGFGRLRKSLEKIFHQFYLEIAGAFGRDLHLHDAVRPSTKVHSGSSECFVHAHQEIAGTQNAALEAESLLQRLAERYADIFDRIMLVHIEITE